MISHHVHLVHTQHHILGVLATIPLLSVHLERCVIRGIAPAQNQQYVKILLLWISGKHLTLLILSWKGADIREKGTLSIWNVKKITSWCKIWYKYSIIKIEPFMSYNLGWPYLRDIKLDQLQYYLWSHWYLEYACWLLIGQLSPSAISHKHWCKDWDWDTNYRNEEYLEQSNQGFLFKWRRGFWLWV